MVNLNSCFISYSTKDEEFAKRLHSRLRDKDVRVWFWQEDVRGGEKLYEQTERAIRSHDKLLIVLSEHSLNSEWVMTELREGRKAEIKEGRRKLFPIRLVDLNIIRNWECFDADSGKDLAIEVREYFIPDFSNWKDPNAFEEALSRLLRDLQLPTETEIDITTIAQPPTLPSETPLVLIMEGATVVSKIRLNSDQSNLLIKLIDAQEALPKMQQQQGFKFSPNLITSRSQLPRNQVIEILDRGETVFLNGQTFTKKEDLPKNWGYDIITHPALPDFSMEIFQTDLDILKQYEFVKFKNADYFFVTQLGEEHGNNWNSEVSQGGSSDTEVFVPEANKTLPGVNQPGASKRKLKISVELPNGQKGIAVVDPSEPMVKIVRDLIAKYESEYEPNTYALEIRRDNQQISSSDPARVKDNDLLRLLPIDKARNGGEFEHGWGQMALQDAPHFVFINKTPIALIMKGGGVKGLAHVGAIKELEKHYEFNWFIGTSAGAIAAVLLAAGYTTSELESILSSKKFLDFLDANLYQLPANLWFRSGLYPADAFTNWMEDLLSKKLDSFSRVELCDLPRRVTVYACHREKDALIFDSADTKTAHTSAAYAVRCSMSIPIVFTPMKEQGLSVFDGGMRHNYPVKKLLEAFPETNFIGLYLGAEHYEGKTDSGIISNLVSIWTEATDHQALKIYKEQTVVIDPRPISTVDFALSKIEKDFLLEAGRLAALKFLSKKKLSEDEPEKRKVLSQIRDNLTHNQRMLKFCLLFPNLFTLLVYISSFRFSRMDHLRQLLVNGAVFWAGVIVICFSLVAFLYKKVVTRPISKIVWVLPVIYGILLALLMLQMAYR